MRHDLRAPLAAAALLVVLLGHAARAEGQSLDNRFRIDTWGAGQGLLPDDSVLALTQTHDGYLWLGTLNGMVRFDGVRFTVFDESNTPKLPSIKIVRLFEDSHSNLWVGTDTAGAALIAHGRVQPLNIGRGGRAGHLVSICEDSTGAVWLLTGDGQLGRYADGRLEIASIGGGAGRSVIADKTGMVWIGVGNKIFGLDAVAARSAAPLRSTEGPVVHQQLDLLLASRAGGYWCLADGVIRKYSGTRVEIDFKSYPWISGLDNVKAACEDRDGNLIVGTGGPGGQGVFWFDAHGTFGADLHHQRIEQRFGLCAASRRGGQSLGRIGYRRLEPGAHQSVPSFGARVGRSIDCPDDQGGVWMSFKGRRL